MLITSTERKKIEKKIVHHIRICAARFVSLSLSRIAVNLIKFAHKLCKVPRTLPFLDTLCNKLGQGDS